MFGSYGSLSSSSSSYNSVTSHSVFASMSSPLDIAPRSSSRRGPDPECAYPSWPRRSSLGEHDASEERATSYIPDEDLFLDVFEDDSSSVSSNGSATPIQSPQPPVLTEAQLAQMQREQLAYEREVRRILLAEKEMRRRQAEQDHRRRVANKRRSASSSSSSSKKGKSKIMAMTPIAEAE